MTVALGWACPLTVNVCPNRSQVPTKNTTFRGVFCLDKFSVISIPTFFHLTRNYFRSYGDYPCTGSRHKVATFKSVSAFWGFQVRWATV